MPLAGVGVSTVRWFQAALQFSVSSFRSVLATDMACGRLGAIDPLLAKSTQSVPHRHRSAGLLKSAEIQARWCQPWVSPRGPSSSRAVGAAESLTGRAQLTQQVAAAQDGLEVCRLLYFGAVPTGCTPGILLAIAG
jgi:hypothetical protein